MSRLNERKSKKKRNVVLFSALGTVLLALLFLPKEALLMEDENPAEQVKDKQPKHTVVTLQPDGTAKEVEKKEQENEKPNDSQASKAEDDPSKKIDIDPKDEAAKKQEEKEAAEKKKAQEAAEKQKAQEEAKKKKAADQPALNQPIGTSQTGPHTSSYEEGSVDWNEKLKAIRMATGLDENMTVWKIANGGGPQKSIAEVSPDGKSNERYIVNLEWVDQKGWKVTSVKK
jgi:outer membrane biosynthesis protein TonB